MKKIELTIQSNGSGGYRLGINTQDSREIFKCRKVKVVLTFRKKEIPCYTACGNPCDSNGNWKNKPNNTPYKKKAYDLNKKELSAWLVKNIIISKTPRQPTRLMFSSKKTNNVFYLTFIENKSIMKK